MEDTKFTLSCLDRRLRTLEHHVLKLHPEEFQPVKKIIKPSPPEVILSKKNVNSDMEKLIKELEEKAENIKVLTEELNNIDLETEEDNLTVATEEALNDVGCIEDLENDTVIKIHHDCKDCLKKKVKLSRTIKRTKKQEEKDKIKRLKENSLKILEEERQKLVKSLVHLN